MTPRTVAWRGSSVPGILQQDAGVGCRAFLQGTFPNPGIEPASPALQADSLSTEPPGKPNILSRFVIAFLPKSKGLLIPWLYSPSTVILELKKTKSVTGSTFPPSIYHEVLGPDAMILVF